MVRVPRRPARPERGELLAPGGHREFRALAPGEPFFFKTHYPHNQVVGGGFYSGFAPLRLSEAWELFGVGNGVGSGTWFWQVLSVQGQPIQSGLNLRVAGECSARRSMRVLVQFLMVAAHCPLPDFYDATNVWAATRRRALADGMGLL